MTTDEFVIWLRGFVKSCSSDYTISPKQWRTIKDNLDMVSIDNINYFNDEESYEVKDFQDSNWNISITSGSWEVKYYNHT